MSRESLHDLRIHARPRERGEAGVAKLVEAVALRSQARPVARHRFSSMSGLTRVPIAVTTKEKGPAMELSTRTFTAGQERCTISYVNLNLPHSR